MDQADRKARSRPGPRGNAPEVALLPGARGFTASRWALEKPLVVLMAMVGAVVLIACANVANVLLGFTIGLSLLTGVVAGLAPPLQASRPAVVPALRTDTAGSAGASRASVLWLVVQDAAVVIAAGAAVGLGAAIGLGRLVRSLLHGIEPRDPATIAIGVALLLTVSVIALLVPARRALTIEPNEALRDE